MVEAIVAGRQPERVTLPGLLEGVPVGWGGQSSAVEFTRKTESREVD
jgi:hypothetical protein